MTTTTRVQRLPILDSFPYIRERAASLNPTILLLISCIVSAIALASTASRIDFHADESIYLSSVPVNTSNDSGLVFHLGYEWGTLGSKTPFAARLVSIGFGIVGIFSLGRALQLLLPSNAKFLALAVPCCVLLSYQGPFSIVRVRPEISWFAIAAFSVWQIVAMQLKPTKLSGVCLLLSSLLLPMNHILSWFPCALIAGYLVLFGREKIGLKMVLASVGCMLSGVVLNSFIRGWIVVGAFTFFPAIAGVGGSERAPISEFLYQVFWASPSFLRDHAATPSLWTWSLSMVSPDLVSHCMIATSIWLVGLAAVVWGKTWAQRYVLSTPLIILGMFYATGYYNPTYAPLVALVALALLLFVAFDSERRRLARLTCLGVLLLSVLNGVSFLSTRVFSHGEATYFAVEAELRAFVDSLPEEAVVAVPERFLSIVADHPGKHRVLFKDELPNDLDFVVIDNYDFEMYRFVPDYEARASELSNLLEVAKTSSKLDKPVYADEPLYDLVQQNRMNYATQGSWFLRNSVAYTVTAHALESPDFVAKAKRRSIR